MKTNPAKGHPPEKTPFIVPVFIPHGGCPHTCAFCDQTAITGARFKGPNTSEARRAIQTFLKYRRSPDRYTEIAFFGGNFLGLAPSHIKEYLDMAAGYVIRDEVQGIRFSTRPDTITPEALNTVAPFPISTVELGAQSMDDIVLARSQRGHRARDTQLAVERLRTQGYEVGLQMMLGLPGDTRESVMFTGRQLVALAPAFVRIYPTVVLKNSPLAAWYLQGRYIPLSLELAVSWTKALYKMFTERGIAVIRMGLPASSELNPGSAMLAGPHHPAFGHLVKAALFYDRAVKLIETRPHSGHEISFRLHPRRISQFRGLANANIAKLQRKFGVQTVRVIPDESVAWDGLTLE
jgi:histone acetyltransferase (RNA polymerase elongator complex component)